MEVGHHFFLLSSILLLIFPCFVEAMKCDAAGACAPVSVFLEKYDTFDLGPKTTKECSDDTDACAVFWCLIDHKKVIAGYGCYSDYVSICGNVSNNAIITVTEFNDRYNEMVIEGVNAKVHACKMSEADCASKKYHGITHLGGYRYFPNLFVEGADKTYDKSCKYGPGAPDASSSSTIGMKQINGFKFFGMIWLGFFVAQIW